MRRAIAAYDKLIDALGVLPGIIIGATALAIGTDVVLRDIGFGGIYGMIEIIEYAILLLAMAGVGHVTRLGRHVTVDIATDLLPARWAWRVSLLAQAIATVVSLIFLCYAAEATYEVWRGGTWLYKSIAVPEWLPLALIPTGFLFVTIELARRLAVTWQDGELRKAGATARDDGI